MKVIESAGERMVFNVESKTVVGKFYRVDLLEQGGYGQCACRDWSIRRGPACRRGLPMGVRETACVHVLAARRHFLNSLLVDLSRRESQ